MQTRILIALFSLAIGPGSLAWAKTFEPKWTSHVKLNSLTTLTKKKGDIVFRFLPEQDNFYPSNLDTEYKGCAGDDWEGIREGHVEQYKLKQYAKSYALLAGYLKRCSDLLIDRNRLWLISEMLLVAAKIPDKEKCAAHIKEYELLKKSDDAALTLEYIDKKVQKSIETNIGLCTNVQRPPEK